MNVDFSFSIETNDWSIDWMKFLKFFLIIMYVCVHGCVYQWHMADGNLIPQISQISPSFCGSQICFEVLLAQQEIQIATSKKIMRKATTWRFSFTTKIA